MAVALQRTEFPPDWQGLYQRHQRLPQATYYAEVARNAEFFGGAIAKRGGINYVNGWSAVTLAGWTTTSGPVDNASGFLNGDVCSITGFPSRTILSVVGNVVTFTVALASAPGPNVAIVAQLGSNGRNPGNALTRIEALFQALWRDGASNLFAIYGGNASTLPMDVVDMKAQPTSLTRSPPTTTVTVNWGTASSGSVVKTETLVAGDTIRVRVGATNVTRGQGVVLSVGGSTITMTAPLAGTPQAGDVVEFMGSIPSSTTAATHFAQYANLTHIVSDSYQPRKVRKLPNATLQVERHGVRPPTSAMTLGVGAAGNPNGTYSYRLKYRNSLTGAESEADALLTAPITVTNQQVSISTIPISPDPQVDEKRIYRTTAGGLASWYLVAILSNATTTFTDNFADVSLPTTPMRQFLDETIPDTARVIALWPHANRLVAISGASVIFSDRPDLDTGFLKGESWPVNNQIFVNYDDGDVITAIAPLFDSLLIFKTRSAWRVTGLPPNITIEPVSFRADRTGIGCLNQKSITTNENEVVFGAQDGMYMVSRYTGVQQGFESSRVTRAIDDLYQQLLTLGTNSIHAIYFRERRQLRVFVPLNPLGAPDPSDVLVFQYEGTTPSVAASMNLSNPGDNYGWAHWDFPVLGLPPGLTAAAVVSGSGSNPDTVYFATGTGQVFTMDTGTHDAGAVITFQYKVVPFQPAGGGIPARGRRLQIAMTPQVTAQAVPATFQLDFDVDFNVSAAQVMMGPVSAGSGLSDVIKTVTFLDRGVHHQFSITEPASGQPVGAGLFSAFRLHRFDYFSQPLPIESVGPDASASNVSYPN